MAAQISTPTPTPTPTSTPTPTPTPTPAPTSTRIVVSGRDDLNGQPVNQANSSATLTADPGCIIRRIPWVVLAGWGKHLCEVGRDEEWPIEAGAIAIWSPAPKADNLMSITHNIMIMHETAVTSVEIQFTSVSDALAASLGVDATLRADETLTKAAR